MPHAKETRRYDAHSGSFKDDAQQQMINLFAFPGLYDLAAVAQNAMRSPASRGRRAHYPAAALLATATAGRATASLPEACKLLRGGTWESCRHQYRLFTGEELPDMPPSRDAVVYFMDKLADNAEVRGEMHRRFNLLSVGMARHLGNLTPGQEPDWAAPSERHTIYGDGTYVTPYSDVREIVDPITGEVFLIGSRATTGRPRIVHGYQLTNSGLDGKPDARGVNHVALHTWTTSGRVVLATGQALGAEATEALDLIDQVAGIAAGGVHTLVYDRAVTGWMVDYLMARHRIQTIGKGVARAAGHEDDDIREVPAARPDGMTAAARRLAAEHGAPYTTDVAPLLRRHEVHRLAALGGPLPLGTSIYPTSRSHDIVQGKYFRLPAVTHQTRGGKSCRHDLAVDDGALFTITADPEHGWAMKAGHASCVSSRPSRDAGVWAVTTTWAIPCGTDTFEHTTRWKPRRERHPVRVEGRTQTHLPTAMRELRPLSRADGARFEEVYGRRNDAESFNNWTKRTLSYKGRAASLRPERQDLDFLAAAILNNAVTWRHRRTD